MTNKIEEVKITLPDGKTFTLSASIDDTGVFRYIRNDLIDKAFRAGLIDLNDIAVMCHTEKVDLKDRIIFWSMIGYSVDGLCDCSFMSPVIVETPYWTKDAQNDEEEQ